MSGVSCVQCEALEERKRKPRIGDTTTRQYTKAEDEKHLDRTRRQVRDGTLTKRSQVLMQGIVRRARLMTGEGCRESERERVSESESGRECVEEVRETERKELKTRRRKEWARLFSYGSILSSSVCAFLVSGIKTLQCDAATPLFG